MHCRDALLIATGSRPALDPLGPFNVDYQGTVNLISAAKAAGVKKVRLIKFLCFQNSRLAGVTNVCAESVQAVKEAGNAVLCTSPFCSSESPGCASMTALAANACALPSLAQPDVVVKPPVNISVSTCRAGRAGDERGH